MLLAPKSRSGVSGKDHETPKGTPIKPICVSSVTALAFAPGGHWSETWSQPESSARDDNVPSVPLASSQENVPSVTRFFHAVFQENVPFVTRFLKGSRQKLEVPALLDENLVDCRPLSIGCCANGCCAKPEGRKILAHGASRWDPSDQPTSPGTGCKSMPHSFASLLVHLIFSTKNRACDLSPDLAARLFPYMAGIVRERKGVPLIQSPRQSAGVKRNNRP